MKLTTPPTGSPKTLTKLTSPLLALVLAVSSLCAVAADPAGKVLGVKGTVTAAGDNGTPRPLAKGNEVFVGDKIVTAKGSYVIVQFVDGAKATVRPDSELVVNQYVFNTDNDSAVLHLVRGGLRAISGGIAKKEPDNFKVKTNVATLGVRGTEFDIRICDQACAEESERLGSTTISGIQGRGFRVLEQ